MLNIQKNRREYLQIYPTPAFTSAVRFRNNDLIMIVVRVSFPMWSIACFNQGLSSIFTNFVLLLLTSASPFLTLFPPFAPQNQPRRSSFAIRTDQSLWSFSPRHSRTPLLPSTTSSATILL